MIKDFKLFENILNNKNWYDLDLPEIKKLLSNLEVKDGYIYLYHFSKYDNLTVLDPQFFGKGSSNKEDQLLPYSPVMFYTKKDHKVYDRLNADYLYEIKYPLNKLYPFNIDPYNFREDPKYYDDYFKNSFEGQMKSIYLGSKDNGFNGLIINWLPDQRELVEYREENRVFKKPTGKFIDVYRVDIWEKVDLSLYGI